MMKRVSTDFRQSCDVDEEARAKLKHQTLLQEFLELQKRFVSQKRKLQTAKQKRDTLLAEVRFLNRRTRYLLKYQSPKFEPVKDPVHPPNLVITQKTLEREGNCNAFEDSLENPCPVWVSNANRRDKEEGKGEEQVCKQALRVGKKPQSYLLNNKRVGKKKISWQDPVTLKVCDRAKNPGGDCNLSPSHGNLDC